MSFVNLDTSAALQPLVSAHFPFPRAAVLREAVSWCATDYYTKAQNIDRFEARGVLVVGESRQGKSKEIDRMLAQFNDGTTIMPDGRPGFIVSCLLSGKVTWKDLGIKILEVLGYPIHGRQNQTYIWAQVTKTARLQGVIGIHFDECQHVFTEGKSRTNQLFLDSFKTLLKDQEWPLMLILSGIPSLETQVRQEQQLSSLLRVVRFDGIDPQDNTDKNELIQLVYSYADKAQLEFDDFDLDDFLERLAFAGCYRWGLVIEMLIEALTIAKLGGEGLCKIDHFSNAFARVYSLPDGYSAFTMPNYKDRFDQEKLMQMLEKAYRPRRRP
ncbi:MAG: ATP-binding protein [Rhodobacteraceae bacterium]|nr:ATP-binding protein [Paracoccaceae bacterium]